MKQKTQNHSTPKAVQNTVMTSKKWYHLNLFQKFALIFFCVVALPVILIAFYVSHQSRISILESTELLIEVGASSMETVTQNQQKQSEAMLNTIHQKFANMSKESLLNLKNQIMEENKSLYAKNIEELVSESQGILENELRLLNLEVTQEAAFLIENFVKESQLAVNTLTQNLNIVELLTGNARQFWNMLLAHEQFVHLQFIDSSGESKALAMKKLVFYREDEPLFTDREPYISFAFSGEKFISGELAKSGVASLRLFIPILNGHEAVGAVFGVVNCLSLWDRMQSRFFNHGEQIYIMDKHGRVVYPHPDIPIAPETLEYLKLVNSADESGGTVDQEGLVMAFATVPSLKWKVVVIQPTSSITTRIAPLQVMSSDYITQIQAQLHAATEEEAKLITEEMSENVKNIKKDAYKNIQTQHESSLANIVGVVTKRVNRVATDAYHQTLWNVLPIITGSGLIAVAIGILVAGKIIKPIKNVTAIACDISQGNVNQSVPEIRSQDEIGLLSQSFHETTTYLWNIAKGAQKISEGEFSNEITPVSEKDSLGIAFRNMTNYLRDIAKLATDISRGDLSQVMTPKSEADVLGNAVYGMMLYLQRIAQVAKKVAGGDLSEDSTPQSEKDFLGNAFAEMMVRLRHIVSKIRTGANQLVTLSLETHSRASEEAASVEKIVLSAEETLSSMTQMAGSIGEVNENMAHLSSFVGESSSSIEELNSSIRQIVSHSGQLAIASEETSSSIQEISASLQQIAETAQHSKTLSDGARQDAIHGRESVEKMIQSMNVIQHMVTVTAEAIQLLNTRTESIDTILGVIKDISDQTSLLSINASIIAKKAGERGRGFTVIADKVRKLADQSNLSAKEIVRIIRDVRKESSHAVEVVSMGSEKVREGVELAELAGKALDKIIAGANESSSVVAKIAGTTEEQTKIGHHIMESMEGVVEMIRQIKAATKEQEHSSAYIMQQTEQVLLLSQQVKQSTFEQTKVVKHVTQTMDNIRVHAEMTSERAKESTQSAFTLSEHADALKQLVSQFII